MAAYMHVPFPIRERHLNLLSLRYLPLSHYHKGYR